MSAFDNTPKLSFAQLRQRRALVHATLFVSIGLARISMYSSPSQGVIAWVKGDWVYCFQLNPYDQFAWRITNRWIHQHRLPSRLRVRGQNRISTYREHFTDARSPNRSIGLSCPLSGEKRRWSLLRSWYVLSSLCLPAGKTLRFIGGACSLMAKAVIRITRGRGPEGRRFHACSVPGQNEKARSSVTVMAAHKSIDPCCAAASWARAFMFIARGATVSTSTATTRRYVKPSHRGAHCADGPFYSHRSFLQPSASGRIKSGIEKTGEYSQS